ncbi:isopenicillin N synthase family dioxygenase [Hyphococcus sp.]|uniref:isopenicillin N synthase family dioxygenase n=1 Tax=Hyphococcus sp. TaxID=2038636 RepID=UPI0035C6DD42
MDETEHKSLFKARYVKDERRFGVQRRAMRELPVIDIGALVDGRRDVDARAKTAAEIRDACINSGFFYIKNYGVSDDDMHVIRDMAMRFFSLPLEKKTVAKAVEFNAARGYQPMDAERITPGYEPDFKEYYDFGLELEDETLAPIDRGTTLWPHEEDLPGFTALMREHVKRTADISRNLIQGFALSLGLDDTYFDEAHRAPFYNMRTSYYPPAHDVLKANRWSCGPHTDYMAFTMLWQDDVGGLEVMNLDGEWIAAPPMPETMVVNVADMMSIWTNDLYTSNPHRVANRADRHRMSIAHFMGPGATTKVECLPTCQGEGNPPRYQPTTTTQHITNIMAKALDPELMRDVKVDNEGATEQLRNLERIGG